MSEQKVSSRWQTPATRTPEKINLKTITKGGYYYNYFNPHFIAAILQTEELLDILSISLDHHYLIDENSYHLLYPDDFLQHLHPHHQN